MDRPLSRSGPGPEPLVARVCCNPSGVAPGAQSGRKPSLPGVDSAPARPWSWCRLDTPGDCMVCLSPGPVSHSTGPPTPTLSHLLLALPSHSASPFLQCSLDSWVPSCLHTHICSHHTQHMRPPCTVQAGWVGGMPALRVGTASLIAILVLLVDPDSCSSRSLHFWTWARAATVPRGILSIPPPRGRGRWWGFSPFAPAAFSVALSFVQSRSCGPDGITTSQDDECARLASAPSRGPLRCQGVQEPSSSR